MFRPKAVLTVSLSVVSTECQKKGKSQRTYFVLVGYLPTNVKCQPNLQALVSCIFPF